MAGISGADTDELERLGRRMHDAANRLDTIRSDVGAAFARTSWEGDDGQHFRDLWQHRLSGLLSTAAGATRDASVVLVRNAGEQRTASADGGGGGLGPACTLRGPDEDGWSLKDGLFLASLGAKELGKYLKNMDAERLAKLAGRLSPEKLAHVVGKLDPDQLKSLGKNLKAAGVVGDVVGGVLDVHTLVNAIQHGRQTGDWDSTKVATADVIADVAFPALEALALATFPPAAIGVLIVDVGWNLFVPPEAKLAAVNGMIDAGHHLADAGGHVVSAVADAGRAVGDVGGAVKDIAVGGFKGALHKFGLK